MRIAIEISLEYTPGLEWYQQSTGRSFFFFFFMDTSTHRYYIITAIGFLSFHWVGHGGPKSQLMISDALSPIGFGTGTTIQDTTVVGLLRQSMFEFVGSFQGLTLLHQPTETTTGTAHAAEVQVTTSRQVHLIGQAHMGRNAKQLKPFVTEQSIWSKPLHVRPPESREPHLPRGKSMFIQGCQLHDGTFHWCS